MTRCRRYGKIRSFIITKSNRRATLSACATLVWPPPILLDILAPTTLLSRPHQIGQPTPACHQPIKGEISPFR